MSVLQPAAVLADPASPVSVVKSADKSTVASGDQLTYTIVITNLGGAKVDNVVMTDQVNGVGVIQNPPALPQLTITSSKGNCTQGGPNGNVVTCNLGTLAGREAVTITIRGQVTAANGTVLNNTASVTGTKSAQTFTTTGSVNVLVSGGTGGGALPDLTINKTGPTSVDQGANLTYTLTVNNIGTANTANVKVVDTLPAGVTLQATPYETTSLFVCDDDSDVPADPITVTCVGGAVNQGQNATIKINAVAPLSGDTITNTSVVDPDNDIEESNELNNTSASVNTSLAGPPPPSPISIVKTDNNPNVYPWSSDAGPDPVNPGELLTYKILVTNEASSRADDVRISDTTQGLEASSIIVSQVVSDGRIGTGRGCVVNAPEVICSVQSLNSGGTILMTITGLVIAPAGSNLFNTATVHGNVKNVGYTNTSSESTTVRPSIDLNIVKTDSPDPACARTWPTTDPNQHLANPPQGLAPAAGSIPDDPDAAGPNDGLLASPVCLGGLTYRFVVGNSGNGDASNVVVRDPLAPGLIFDSWDTQAGSNFTCAVNGSNVVTCSGGFIPAAQTRWIELRLVAPPDVGSITNTVYVDPNNAIFEPDETNNTDTETTAISTGIDLVIWKGDSVDPDPPGNDLSGAPTLVPGTAADLGDGYDPIATRGTQTYTIYVDNVGTQDVTGIRVRDTLPADTIFLSAIADNDHGFTCTHNGAQFGGVIECVGGHLRGTEAEFYDPAGPTGPTLGHDDFATIKIRVFARATVGTMHNEARVDPLNEIAEVNELNNIDTETTTVGVGNADKGAYNQLTVEKTQFDPSGDDPVATNGILIYDLKVSNLGTDPVSAIVVKDTLPSGTRFISAKDTDVGTSLSDAFFCSHDGSATGGVVTCVSGDLSGSINVIPDGLVGNVPTFRTIRITVFAPNIPGTIVNLATVDPDNTVAEGNEFDNDAFEDTAVRPCTSFPDCTATNAFYELKLTKEQTNPTNPVARNGIVTYKLTVENWGSDPVSGVVVTDRLPAGFTFISAADTAPGEADAFTCTGPDASGVLTCSGGSFDAGLDSRSIEINVFAPDEPGSYVNNAFVDPLNTIPEGNEFNNQASLQTIVANAGNRPYIDLTIDKTQVKALDQDEPTPGTVRVVPGGGILYQLKITNIGEDGDAFNVRVRDFLPANVTFFKAEDTNPGPGAFTCGQLPGQPNTIDCVGGMIPQDGGFRTINVVAVAPTGLDQIASDPGNIQQVIVNSAFVDPLNEIPEGNEINNTDSIETLIQSQINLTVEKEGPDQANQNQEADYKITVTNHKIWGDGRIAFDAVVVDYLPVGLIPLSVSANVSNMACQVEENPVNLVTCVGDLEPDVPVEITVHVFITAESGALDNEACVDPDHLIDETSELDNCKTKTTQVEPPPAPNLNINKNASTGTVTAGEEFSYTVTVANVGNADAPTGITVTDPLPSQVTFKSATATNGFTCTEAAGTVTCNDSGSGLAAGQSTVITIEVTVNSGVTGSFTNTATVSGESASVTTNVGGTGIDLILTDISDSPDPANIGQNVTYTFAVSNAGTSPSGAFSFTAKMDSGALNGLKYVGGAASQGFICGAIATDTVTCTGSLLPGQATNVSLVFQVLAGTPTSHTLEVKVDPTNVIVESSELNNDDTEVTTVTGSLCTNCVDLVAGGILDTPDPVAPGGSITRIATMSNAGDVSTAVLGPGSAVIWVVLDGDYETLGSYSATGGFTCSDGAFGNLLIVECVGDLAAGQGVALTVNSTASSASDGDTLFSYLFADPYNTFPEGTGTDHEFTDANNQVTEATSVVS
jgi:uncharacterized repeat protein (TIGR01451 family)